MVKEKRNRYVIFRIMSSEKLDLNKYQLLKIIFSSVLKLYGEVGASFIHINLIEYDANLQKGIIKCNHNALVMLRAALCIIHEINGKQAFFHIIKVTGTLKKAREILNSLPKSLTLGDEEAVPVV